MLKSELKEIYLKLREDDRLQRNPKFDWISDDFTHVIDVISDYIPFSIEDNEDAYVRIEDKLINSLLDDGVIINSDNE